MWKLTIEDDEQKQIFLPLVHSTYAVGREEANEIRLTERNISRKHATLTKTTEGWAVRDLDSYNGTYVNGIRVAGDQAVAHGDIIQLGDYRLEMIDEGQLAAPSVDARSDRPKDLAPHHRPDRLVVVVGPQPGQEFFLDQEKITIGRSEDAVISINHSSVSRIHADLAAVGNGRYEVIDRNSANGIRINGQDVRRGFVEAGDAIELGDVRLRFVGAGKIFRAGFDRSQALPAMTGYDDAIRSSKPSSGSIVLRMVAVGAVLGVLGVGATAAYIALSKDGESLEVASGPSTPQGDPGTLLLRDAVELRRSGDLAGAHEKIALIPTTSPTLKDPTVGEIEGAWADELFAEAAKHKDEPEKQVEYLWKIATTPTVDEKRRRKAGEMLREVGVEMPEDPAELKPNTPAPTTFRPAPPPSAKASASASARVPGAVDRETLDRPQDKKAELLGRFNSLSPAELRKLIGLCQQTQDFACAGRASKRMTELSAQEPKQK